MSVDQRIVTATEQLEADVKLTHDIVHGDENTEVTTEGGKVPTHAKVAKDSNEEITGLLQPTVNDINQHAIYVDGKVSEVKADANRADAAADRADKIAELETVRDALRLAAVPAPDFHLPLISDLRIQEGFGEPDQIDVSAAQDGSLMVDLPTRSAVFTRASTATYINKSGNLTIAGVDEPRFEKEGILIEGESTNMVLDSADGSLDIMINTEQSIDSFENIWGGNESFKFSSRDSSSSVKYAGKRITNLVPETTYTGSVWLHVGENGILYRLTVYNPLDQSFLNTTILDHLSYDDGWFRATVTFTTPKIMPDYLGLYVYLNTDSTESSYAYYDNWQVEALPFASGYILTTDSPVTRAVEKLSAIIENNLPERSEEFTIAVVCSALGSTGTFQTIYDINSSSGVRYNLRSTTTPAAWYGGSGINLSKSYEHTAEQIVVQVCTGKVSQLHLPRLGYVSKSFGKTPNLKAARFGLGSYVGSSGNELYGHIRDFRIWHKALTDEQISALGGA